MIKWGILGMGKIAQRMSESLKKSPQGYLYAVASFSEDKCQQWQRKDPSLQVYHTYEALLDDPEVDAVYIAMRHQDHFHWAKEALKRKKAVLCEKPATLSFAQTAELCQIARDNHCFFMEAMKTRFIPLIDDIKKVLESGGIGDIVHIEAAFCSQVDYCQEHYLFDQKQGGALYDVGMYPIASILDYITSPLKTVKTQVDYCYGVDAYVGADLCFDNGQTAHIDVAIDRDLPKSMTIYGTKGTLTAMPFYRPEEATVTIDGHVSHLHRSYLHDDFYTEIEAVHHSLQRQLIEHPRMYFQDSLRCMEVMEAIRRSWND